MVATPGLLVYLPASRMHFRGLTRGLSTEPMMGFILLVPLVIVLAHAGGGLVADEVGGSAARAGTRG